MKEQYCKNCGFYNAQKPICHKDNDNFLFEQVSKFNTLDDINTTIKYVNSYFGLNIKEIKFDNENTR